MRLSPDGRRLVFVAGFGQHPPSPMVTMVLEDGRSVPMAPGHHPAWVDGHSVVWSPQTDGHLGVGDDHGPAAWIFNLVAGNTAAAAAGMAAVGRTDPRRVILSNGRVIPGAMDPALSDDGVWLAYVMADRDVAGNVRDGISTLWVGRADGSGGQPRALWEGAPMLPRFGGTTLVWEIGRGLIAGCADVANPAVGAAAFTLPSAWRLSHPVPVWVPALSELLVLFVADAGELGHLFLASWTSLKLGEPRGYAIGTSTGSAFDHDARPIAGTPDGVAVCWLDPAGLLDGVNVQLGTARVILAPPVKPAPPPPPPVLPDIAWTFDATRTVDMLDYVTAAATARRDHGDGTGDLWLHKSQERPNWGENWDFDAKYIGFVEDRSTGTRMVSMVRPKHDAHTNTTRNRLSPEEILTRNAAGENLGDPLTLPLAGYTWRGNRVWMIRHVTGRASISQHTDYVWWDLPELGGVWEVWAGLALTMEVETGYARYNGHEVFARTRYGKPKGSEWNYWGPHGWIGFFAFNADGTEEVAARSVRPAGGGASPLNQPFVWARFAPTFPIYDAARERQEPKMSTATTEQIAAFIGELDDPVLLGARQRYRDEVLLSRDRVSAATDGDGQPANHTDMMTGGAAMFFDRSYVRDYLIARVKGQDVMGASVAGLIGAADAYRRAVGIVAPTQPGTPRPAFAGPISTSGRDFVTP